MKKIMLLMVTLSLLFYCSTKQDEVAKIVEDGVEVVINHLEPYKLKGEPANLNLEEEFAIDTEKDEILEVGVTDIKDFDIDSEGNVYFFQERVKNGNYLKYGEYFDPESKHRYNILQLYNSKFEELTELDRCDHGPVVAFTQKKMIGTPRVFICKVSDGRIYVGHENRGYEILIYDLEGNLVKKIRKEYNPTDVPLEFKENWLVNIGRWKDRLVFPDKMPPFHYFFLDDEGRLYVKTYEKGDKQNEYMHDIFNSDGIFITRKSIAGYGRWIYPGIALDRAKAKNKRLYCIREKESGYKELVVYKMTWE